MKKPDYETLCRLLEEAYVRLSRKYGWSWGKPPYIEYGAPIHVGGKHIWGKEGLFEELNKLLRQRGYSEITWDEFKQLLKSLEKPELYAKIWVSWIIAPNGKVEPHDMTFYEPVFLRESEKIVV